MSTDWKMSLRVEAEICHISITDIVHEELETEWQYLNRLRSVQKCNLNNATDHCWLRDVDDLRWNMAILKILAAQQFKLAVVWFDGSWPRSPAFEHSLLAWAESQQDTRWYLAGHIINREHRNQYPRWHHQCIVINLPQWVAAGSPQLDCYDSYQYAGYTASSECIHDDYTPLRLDPVLGDTNRRLGSLLREDFWDQAIHGSLGRGYSVLNLPESVREEKICIYPEDDIAGTKRWLLNQDLQDDLTPRQLWERGFELPEDKLELWGYKIQNVQVMYVTNTETVPVTAPRPGIREMAVPCSGLHQFWHAAWHIDTLKRVLWYDFNAYSVAWMKLVLAEWDGRDFESFYRRNIDRVISDGVIDPDNVIFDSDLVDKFLERMGGEDAWLQTWQQIQQLEHDFVVADIVKQPENIVDRLNTGDQPVFFQCTNIWQYESNYLNTDHLYAQKAFIDLITDLNENNGELWVTGDTPGGVHYNYQNVALLTGIY